MFAAKPDRVDLSVVLEDDDLWAQNSSSASTSRSRTRGAAGPRPVEADTVLIDFFENQLTFNLQSCSAKVFRKGVDQLCQ